MSGTFRQSYAALTRFIKSHPEIEIGDSVTSIPEDIRPAFYALFNAARHVFVAEAFPEYLSRADLLRQQYCRAAEEAAQWISFEEGPAVSKCGRYLRDPEASLARELFDLLFDLLKKRETQSSFRRKASNGIESHFPIVHRSGYEKWAVLSLVKLLEVQKAYRVPVRDLQPGDRAKSSNYAPVEEVPAPVESARYLFSQSPKAIFAVPDFILQSGKLKRFIGFRSEFKEGLYNAANASMEREWRRIDPALLVLLENGMTLIYAADKPESIALVGDVAKFCSPDLMLWCVDSRNLNPKEALDTMTLADSLLRPAKGIFIVATEPWPETGTTGEPNTMDAPAEGGNPRIRILTAGYDCVTLMPVIDALSNEE